MKVTGVIPILLLFLINGYVNCQNFEYNNNVHFEDGNFSLTVVFQVQATYNSVTGDVCARGVTNDTANFMCQNTSNLQATGFVTTDYSTFVFNSVAYSVDCSSGIDTCPGTQVSNCDSYGGLLAVKCVIPIPECYSQSVVMLSNPVNTSIPSGGYYVTGHPVTCSSSGNYVPICNSVNIGPLEIIAICAYTIIGSGGFNGAPSGVTVPPPTLRSSDTVSNQFSCSGSTYSNLNCSGNSVISSCPNGYATVTCQKVCDEDYYATLFNSQTATIDGISYTIGIPQFCITGTYARICNDGTNSPELGLALCNSAGFLFGELLSSNSSLAETLYRGSPQGILYLNRFLCSGHNCQGDSSSGFASNPQCFNGQLETIVRCSNIKSYAVVIGVTVGILVAFVVTVLIVVILVVVFMVIRNKRTHRHDGLLTINDDIYID